MMTAEQPGIATVSVSISPKLSIVPPKLLSPPNLTIIIAKNWSFY
jgi:hypothetical protein